MSAITERVERDPGHCCFLPATQDCHAEEVAAWERERDRLARAGVFT